MVTWQWASTITRSNNIDTVTSRCTTAWQRDFAWPGIMAWCTSHGHMTHVRISLNLADNVTSTLLLLAESISGDGDTTESPIPTSLLLKCVLQHLVVLSFWHLGVTKVTFIFSFSYPLIWNVWRASMRLWLCQNAEIFLADWKKYLVGRLQGI